jgi:hypothetical protein
MTWEQSSRKCIRDDTDLVESLEGEEGGSNIFHFVMHMVGFSFESFYCMGGIYR